MKYKIISVLLVFLLSISIVACSNDKSNSTISTDEEYLVMEAYKALLQNKANFFSTDDKKYVYFNDFLKGVSEDPLKVTNFTVIDMDGDKIPEVILELLVNDCTSFEVLHYNNGTVYGYNFVYRALMQLKTDGTFIYSNGAQDNGYGKLIFESNACKTDILGCVKSSYNNDIATISYFINEKQVTEELYASFCEKQDRKEDVVWYEFCQKNIETELFIN